MGMLPPTPNPIKKAMAPESEKGGKGREGKKENQQKGQEFKGRKPYRMRHSSPVRRG
jgi:hypothetical protein